MATIQHDAIDLNDAEEFSLPSGGGHYAFLGGAELGRNKKDTHDMITVGTVLVPDDPDAPNFPMRYFLMWPNPDDKGVMWGTRSAYGSMISKIKEFLTAVGGPESGSITKEKVMMVISKNEGKKIKIQVKRSIRSDMDENDPRAQQANIESVEPA